MARLCFLVLLTAGFCFINGCKTGDMGASATTMPSTPTRAVLVTSGQGSTVVFIPGADPSKPMMLVTQGTTGAHECEQCEADIAKYFSTGELAAKCPVCGATRTPLVLPPPNMGHN